MPNDLLIYKVILWKYFQLVLNSFFVFPRINFFELSLFFKDFDDDTWLSLSSSDWLYKIYNFQFVWNFNVHVICIISRSFYNVDFSHSLIFSVFPIGFHIFFLLHLLFISLLYESFSWRTVDFLTITHQDSYS